MPRSSEFSWPLKVVVNGGVKSSNYGEIKLTTYLKSGSSLFRVGVTDAKILHEAKHAVLTEHNSCPAADLLLHSLDLVSR